MSLTALLLASTPRIAARPGRLPPIVFVSRQALPDEPGALPGLGPAHRTAAPGGRLLVRERDGRLRPLLPEGMVHDVSDPSVSWDGKRVAFAATVAPDSAWRIWVVNADGTDPAPVTRSDRRLDAEALAFQSERFRRYDDIDPCWLPDERICFASTRWPQRAQYADVPVTNLYVVGADGTGLQRITSERNGADEPSVDPTSGRIVYARWLFNRYRPSDLDTLGVTLDPARAVPQDTINLWQAVSVLPDGDGIRLAGGDPRARSAMMAYEPVVLDDSTLVGVYARLGPMMPAPGGVGLQVFPGGFAAARRPLGPGTATAAMACSPAVLPDQRLLLASDLESPGDMGLYVMKPDGSRLARVLDLPATLELDADVLAPRKRPPVLAGECAVPPSALPHTRPEHLADSSYAFRFDCLNVFTNGPVNSVFPDAPRLAQGLRIRFFGVLSRPEAAGGDTLVLVREAPVSPSGAIHVDDIPADAPIFEQLVDAQGRIVRSTSGPAHVPGYNFARLGSGTKCVGCHTGHSALAVPLNYWSGKWFNIAPSATVSVSSLAAGAPQALVDRRTRGPADQVAWVAAGADGESILFRWDNTVEVKRLVLYAMSPEPKAGTSVRVLESVVSFLRGGHEVKRLAVRRTLRPGGTRVDCDPVRVDAIEIRLTRVAGRFRAGRAAALAEVEILARLLED